MKATRHSVASPLQTLAPGEVSLGKGVSTRESQAALCPVPGFCLVDVLAGPI